MSVQITCTAPRASTAFRLVTSTFFFAMRRLPMASARVRVGSSPSGTLATMMPIMNTRLIHRGRPLTTPYRKKVIPMVQAMAVRMRTMRDTSRSSGEAVRRMVCDSPAMRPKRVRSPVANTTPRPVPRTTVQPAKARLAHSSRGRSSAAGSRRSGCDSPVSGEVSISSESLARMRTSAAILSPSASRRRSPGTTAAASTRSTRPARTTSAMGGKNCRSAAMARSARYSWKKLNRALSRPTTTKAQPSRPSPSAGLI